MAVVTGGNRGIGFEVCRQLTADGYEVVLGSRDAAKGEEAAASVVWAVTILDDGPSGGFFRDGQPLPW